MGGGEYYSLYYCDEVSSNYNSYNLLIYNHNVNEYLPQVYSLG